MPTLVTHHSKRWIAGGLFLVFWVSLVAVRRLPFSVEGWSSLVPLRCPLAWIFQIACPTCGLGRSLIAAAMGHEQESLRYHPLGLLLFWGGQILWLCWMLWPSGWESLRDRWLAFCQGQKPLLWCLVLLYSIWGFCWRTPI